MHETAAVSQTAAALRSAAAPLEKAILVSLLDNLPLLQKTDDIIDESDFFNAEARELYTWLKAQHRAGSVVDASLAMSVFSGHQLIESYLLDVLSAMPVPSALMRQAEELRDLAIRNKALHSLNKVLASVADANTPVEAELSKLTQIVKASQEKLQSNQDTTMSYGAVKEIWREKFKKRVEGNVSYLATGYDELDSLILGLEPEDFVIIGARPSMGKTTFAMNVVENIATKIKGTTLVFSLEMPKDSLYQRSLSSIGGVDFEDLRKGTLKVGDFEKLELADSILAEAPIYIDDTPALTLDQLRARAYRQHQKTPLKLIMVDYLQLMSVSKHTLGNRNEGIGEISRGLKQLARDLKCSVVALSQLSRNLETRADKRPINSDLRDSGSIEQDADVILFVYRDEVYNNDSPLMGVVEIIIGKQRNGPLGTARLSFAKGQSRMSNLTPIQQARLDAIDHTQQNESARKNAGAPNRYTPPGKRSTPGEYESSGGSFALTANSGSVVRPNQDHLASVAEQLA